ncbi:uncharacterized protein EURHEDRAFT_541953 [Aspergillus ruber CBS 135680]|uniref:Amidohydrolase-related domain-containing protein n=1 Tax=Aspergillus ruber (strain CBS 135680) TaxID=1388766 RepID=A0A017SAL2_ASPRC|nr:uncharacterized protein EURHEDRAFT_541953 [Aspergillus ruber CBS 135680]EYE93240.1 hypothetical protein EURHEDRAFT_541953 [Aspergillus ruber CBS 135680]
MPFPIVDSHIHLFPASHLPSLAWYGPNSPLGSQHCVDEYRQATSSTPIVPDSTKSNYHRGFIFIETDRISSIEESGYGWKHVLDEVSLLAQIVRGEPIDEDQYRHVDRPPCLGIVPWAPVLGGAVVLERYMDKAKEAAGTDDVWRRVRGVRYLVQDKPSGVMLQPGFIDGLKWLGRENLTFDLGVSARQGALWQLREAVEMMERVYEGVDEKDQVVMVINHLCKPNLRLPYTSPESITTNPDFLEWKAFITAMAQHPKTYMKLSGGFSELPLLTPAPEPDIPSLVERLHPWTDVVFDAFGPGRVMFGSDWPVCNLGGGGNDVTWRRWKTLVEDILERRGLSEEQRRGIWGEVALEAYGIKTEGL